jgi:hypothetical protein
MNPTADGKGLYRALLACLVVASLPIKNLAYVTPALYLLILLLHGEYRVVCRVALLYAVILVASCVAILWDHLGGRVVNLPGLWMGLVTYAPLIVIVCETFDRTIDDATYDKFINVCCWFILLQSAIGVLQFVATGNGDAVCGSFGLLDGFQQSITIAQVYFTFTILGMILFVLPAANRWLPRVAITAGALSCVLAQSGHQTIFFIVSLMIAGMLRISHIATLARTVVAVGVTAVLVLVIYPDTIWLTREWFGKVTDPSSSPKRLALDGAASILSEPKNLMIGTGLGQYASRAALITSNEYLAVELPALLTGKSDYYNDYIHPANLLFEQMGEGSAIVKPYMSVVNLTVELGLVISIALAWVMCRAAIRSVRLMMGSDGQLGWIGFSMTVGILFFLLCSCIENYAEFCQAIIVPFILFVVAGSRAQTILNAAVGERVEDQQSAFGMFRPSYALAQVKPRRH